QSPRRWPADPALGRDARHCQPGRRADRPAVRHPRPGGRRAHPDDRRARPVRHRHRRVYLRPLRHRDDHLVRGHPPGPCPPVRPRWPPPWAGVGSAVNDAPRNLGGVLGVAVVGSVAASAYASHLGAFHAAGPAATAAARQSLGAAAAIARSVGGPHGAALFHTAATAFVTGADRGILVPAAATLTGMIVAPRALRGEAAAPSYAKERRTPTR